MASWQLLSSTGLLGEVESRPFIYFLTRRASKSLTFEIRGAKWSRTGQVRPSIRCTVQSSTVESTVQPQELRRWEFVA
jgi:hypothetical protein